MKTAINRIEINPEIRSGKPNIRGTRITVQDVLGYLAAGETKDSVLEIFGILESEDIDACFAYANYIMDTIIIEETAS